MDQFPQIGGGGGDWAVVDKKRLTELPWGKPSEDPQADSYLGEFISVWWTKNWSQTDSHKHIILNLHIHRHIYTILEYQNLLIKSHTCILSPKTS